MQSKHRSSWRLVARAEVREGVMEVVMVEVVTVEAL